MIDDLLELVLDIVGEMVGAVVESKVEKRRRTKKERPSVKGKEPWERRKETPPWEEIGRAHV